MYAQVFIFKDLNFDVNIFFGLSFSQRKMLLFKLIYVDYNCQACTFIISIGRFIFC